MFNDQQGITFHETRQLTSKTTNQYHTDVVGQWAIRHLDNSHREENILLVFCALCRYV